MYNNTCCHIRLSTRRRLIALNQLKQSPDQTRKFKLAANETLWNIVFALPGSSNLITVVTVKLHRTMAKGERWVQARSPSLIPLEAQNFAVWNHYPASGTWVFNILTSFLRSIRVIDHGKCFFLFVSHLKINMRTINCKITVHSPKVAISQRTTPKDQLWKKKNKEIINMYRFTIFRLFISLFIS